MFYRYVADGGDFVVNHKKSVMNKSLEDTKKPFHTSEFWFPIVKKIRLSPEVTS